MFGFSDKPARIKTSCSDSIKKYIIVYPEKKGITVKIGADMLRNITKNSAPIVLLDTSISLMDERSRENNANKLMDLLNTLGIKFFHRVIPSEESTDGKIVDMLLFGRKDSDREIITFQLNIGFDNDELLSLIALLGCEIYIPNSFYDDIIQDVFNFNFQDKKKRLDVFKYVIYINDLIGQAALTTKSLEAKDVDYIVGNERAHS